MFRSNPNLLPVEIDDELVMVSEDQEHFISLNPIGKLIFDALSSPKSLEEIIHTVLAHCEVSYEQCKTDIEPFLMNLIQHNVIFES